MRGMTNLLVGSGSGPTPVVPDGKTVTPINDAKTIQFYGRSLGGVQTWLYKANITNKTYTTLSDVLADTTTLAALMSSQAAVDYLVTATSWATDVCANQAAMSYIGLNNYAANTLLADSTWREAICNSTYFESVLNVKVPTMTSNTAPSGVADMSPSVYSGHPAYMMFNGVHDANNYAAVNTNTNYPHYYSYQFTSAMPLYRVDVYVGRTGYSARNCILQWLNGSAWTNIESFEIANTVGTTYRTYDGSISAASYRLQVTSSYYTTYNWSCIFSLQFYGRQDV